MSTRSSFKAAGVMDTEALGFAQAVQVGNCLWLSGQVGWTKALELAGDGGIEAQAYQAMEHIQALLTEAAFSLQDVVRIRFYVVGLDASRRLLVRQLLRTYFRPPHLPVSTLIGLECLAAPELLIEIEVTACCPSSSTLNSLHP